MSKVKAEKTASDNPAQKSRAAEIAGTLESLIVTFALVLTWRICDGGVPDSYRQYG